MQELRTTAAAAASYAAPAALAATLLIFDPLAYEPHHARWIAATVFAVCLTYGLAPRGPLAARDAVTVMAVALAVYAGASVIWSADPAAGAVAFGHTLVMTVVFLASRCLDAAARARLAAALALATAATLSMWAADIGRWGGIGNPNFLSETLVAGAAFAAIAAFSAGGRGARAGFASIAVLALGATVFLLPSRAGALAAVVGLAVFGTMLAPFRWRLALGFAAIVGGIAAIAITTESGRLSLSLDSRVQLWANGAAMLADRPIAGVGLGGFDALYPVYQERHLSHVAADTPVIVLIDRKSIRVGALHNEILQFAVAFGAIGVLLALGFAASIVARMFEPKPPAERLRHAAAVAGLAGLAIVAAAGFPLQLPHTQIMTALLLGFVAPAASGTAAAGPGRAGWVLAALIPALLLATATTIGQHLLGRSLAAIAHEPSAGVALARRALGFAPADPAVKAWSFVAEIRRTELDSGYVPARAALDAAYGAANTPLDSSLLVLSARLQYLINFGAGEADDREAVALSDRLTAYGARVQEFWILAAALKMKLGDPHEASRRIERARGLASQSATAEVGALLDAMAAAAAAEIAAGRRTRLSLRIQLGFDRV